MWVDRIIKYYYTGGKGAGCIPNISISILGSYVLSPASVKAPGTNWEEPILL